MLFDVTQGKPRLIYIHYVYMYMSMTAEWRDASVTQSSVSKLTNRLIFLL